MVKLPTKYPQIALVLRRKQAAVEGYLFLEAQLFVSSSSSLSEQSVRKHRSLLTSVRRGSTNWREGGFAFNYVENDEQERAVLCGLQDSELNERTLKQKTLSKFEKELSAHLVSNVIGG